MQSMMMHCTDGVLILIISIMVFSGVIRVHKFKYMFDCLQGGDVKY